MVEKEGRKKKGRGGRGDREYICMGAGMILYIDGTLLDETI